jgi:hypothetical protein
MRRRRPQALASAVMGEGGREARKKERVLVGEKQGKIKMLV